MLGGVSYFLLNKLFSTIDKHTNVGINTTLFFPTKKYEYKPNAKPIIPKTVDILFLLLIFIS